MQEASLRSPENYQGRENRLRFISWRVWGLYGYQFPSNNRSNVARGHNLRLSLVMRPPMVAESDQISRAGAPIPRQRGWFEALLGAAGVRRHRHRDRPPV